MNNWTTNATKVRAWAENQDPSDKLNAVMLSLTLGETAESDELRSTYWTAIRSIGSTMEGFPSARRGRESSLTDEQEAYLLSSKADDLFTSKTIANAIYGTKIYNQVFSLSEGLNTTIAPAHLPIINDPQYNEISGAISESLIAFNPNGFRFFFRLSTNFKSSPKLD